MIDRWLIPPSRGRLKVAIGQPILLLHTRGARSGQLRTSPLLYTPRGDAVVIVASKAGDQHHPAWYHNLRAHPESVTIEIHGTCTAVHPRIAHGAEREALWRLVNDNYNGYEAYQDRAGGRIIPIVVLEPSRKTMPGSTSALQRQTSTSMPDGVEASSITSLARAGSMAARSRAWHSASTCCGTVAPPHLQ